MDEVAMILGGRFDWDREVRLEAWLEAARRGDTAQVVGELDRGMDVDVRDSIGDTALMRAVRGGHVELIRILLDRGARVDPVNTLGDSALTYAIYLARNPSELAGDLSANPLPLAMLLAAGARYSLRDAVLLADIDLVRLRLDEGDDVETGEGTYHGPVLKMAVGDGHLEIARLLLDRGANLEQTNDINQRPLLVAASQGRAECVQLLLDRGAEIDHPDSGWLSPLSEAALHGRDETYFLLLSRGARRGLVDTLLKFEDETFRALLKKSLRENPDDDLNGDYADDPEGHLEGETILLRDPKQPAVDGIGVDGEYLRLATLAAGRGSLSAIQLLLDLGAAHLAKRVYLPSDHRSLLAEAARHGRIDVIPLLLARGADLHAVGRDERTPLAWAIAEGQEATADLLRRLGASR